MQVWCKQRCGSGTTAAYSYVSCLAALLQTLYESSIAFGMRKALTTEQGKGEMETHITQLEGSVKDLERQVRTLSKPAMQAVLFFAPAPTNAHRCSSSSCCM